VGAVDIKLSGLFKRTTIAVSDIGDIEDSIFWQGYVIHLLKPHAALSQFIVPWYFGSERTSAVAALRSAQNRENR
jgi:hypothetical protein